MKQFIWKRLLFILICLTVTSCATGEKKGIQAAGQESIVGNESKTESVQPESRIQVRPDYVIGPGDVLEISVWKDEVLNKQVPVLPDGKIAYPLISQVVASGKTIDQLKAEIENKISRYIPDPDLNIAVMQVNSMVIYVIGKVNRPGNLHLQSNINVLQALAMAGGLNPFAKKNKIKIFRKTGDNTRIYEFEYSKVSGGEQMEMNIQLQRGDVIVVP